VGEDGPVRLTRAQVLRFRVTAQQLDRPSGGTVDDTAVLDLGVQDTGPDGGRWALAVRGVGVDHVDDRVAAGDLVLVWSLRGAPHFYRRSDLRSVAAALEPFSDRDAGSRIFDAAKPLAAAGIGNVAALDAVAAAMRSIVTEPMVKGEVSTRLTAVMDPPYLRFCRSCNATHLYEQPFRLGALRAGLGLQPGTSPPVLVPLDGFRPARSAQPRHDVVRGSLHLLGPATPKLVAGFLDAPVADVTERWPSDTVEVTVEGETRWVLTADLPALDAARRRRRTGVALLGPYDLFLQARDRPLLVPDARRAKQLWPVLGRPGAILRDADVVGSWRPRASGRRLRVLVDLWDASAPDEPLVSAAERLAASRGVELAGVEPAGPRTQGGGSGQRTST
jgi:hypothetical protein